ncbi:hypothetical protein [Acidipila rosea]|uniref:hypothetical protein n=1 Tax=Acidipila rosea TaxID=768535 RepID=UPI00104DF2DF|nr:hypothetical protein [Acidipila rosea]MBW4046148.1 hypothetical protein [Acidobacteriota bacterium]
MRAVQVFLAFRVISEILLLAFYESHHVIERAAGVSPSTTYNWYFYSCWAADFIGAALLFFMLQSIFRYALTPLPGISQLGIQAFRWAGVVSIIVSASAFFTPATQTSLHVSAIGTQLMRCMGIVELCLLAFFVMTLHKLGLNFRSRIFGISLATGIMATMDFIVSAVATRRPDLVVPLNNVQEFVIVFALGTWATYMLVPEPARKPVAMSSTSPLAKWNEIAKALGHGPAYIAVNQPANASFLQDVEKVVERVKARNSFNAAG